MITWGDVRKWKADGYNRQIDPAKDAEEILANPDFCNTIYTVQGLMNYCVEKSESRHPDNFIRNAASDHLINVKVFRPYLEKDDKFQVMEEHIGFREAGEFWIVGDGDNIPWALRDDETNLRKYLLYYLFLINYGLDYRGHFDGDDAELPEYKEDTYDTDIKKLLVETLAKF